MGVETIVEVGPKKVLSGLIRNIGREIRLFYIGDSDSLQTFSELGPDF